MSNGLHLNPAMTSPQEAAVVTRFKIQDSGPTPNRNTALEETGDAGGKAGPPGTQPWSPNLSLTAKEESRTTEGAQRPLPPLSRPRGGTLAARSPRAHVRRGPRRLRAPLTWPGPEGT